MGKIADALEKAGYENDLGVESLDRSQDTEQEPRIELELSSDEKLEFESETTLKSTTTPEPVQEIGLRLEPKSEHEQEDLALELEATAATAEEGKRKKKSRPDSGTEPPAKQKRKKVQPGSGAWDERLFKAVNNISYFPEIFKTLRTRILHPVDDRPQPKTIMITSAMPREGKSFISANLGVSLAQGMDQYSLLVDCDLRRPSLAGLFGMENKRGLVDYLRDHEELSNLIAKTSINKLSILPSGKPPVNPSELLGSDRMNALVGELSARYDDRLIIFDSPPVQVASETRVLAGQVDGVILVVRERGGRKAQIEKIIDEIGADHILGIVFNSHTTNLIEKTLMGSYGEYSGYYSSAINDNEKKST